MTRCTVLAILLGFLLGLALGCGSSNTPEVVRGGGDPGSKPPEAPKPIPKEELPAAESKLAQLDKTIAAKEKELADLKAEADALRKQIAAAKAPKDKVYRSAAALIVDMPRDAYPKSGPMGNAERRDAEKWLKANVVGRTIEWTATVTEVTDGGTGPYDINISTDAKVWLKNSFGASSHISHTFGPQVPLGGESFQFLVDWPLLYDPEYKACTRSELDTLRKLKGMKATFRAKVTDVYMCDGLSVESTKHPAIEFKVSQPSVNGFLPEATKTKEDK